MALQFSAEQAELIAKAYTGGVETSVRQLAELLGLAEVGRLGAAREVVDFVHRLKLELVPGPSEGEFDTIRVLRSGVSSKDSLTYLRKLLQAGEGPSVEFKSSMFCSMREWEKTGSRVEHSSLPGEILKTVCAFLNSAGGDLLVGVSDDGEPCPGLKLDQELKQWNLDKWQLYFHSLISGRFYDGPQIPPYLRCQMFEVDKTSIYHVQVMPRARPSFVQREKGQRYEFFVRNGPRTDSLDLPSFYGHLVSRGSGGMDSTGWYFHRA